MQTTCSSRYGGVQVAVSHLFLVHDLFVKLRVELSEQRHVRDRHF